MSDFSEAEIGALEAVIPSTVVYECDFHCEQAWERWVKDSKHGVSASDSDWLLDQLRACAWAPLATPSEGVPFHHHFQQAVSVFKPVEVKHHASAQWMTGTWLKMSKERVPCNTLHCMYEYNMTDCFL